METFNTMPALPPGAVTAADDGMSMNAGQQPLGLEGFEQEMPFDEYAL